MVFYGIVGFFSSFYFGLIIFWDIGGGFDIFNKKGKKVCFVCWGFFGKNCCIIFEIFMNEFYFIRIIIEVKEEGIFICISIFESIVYLEIIE